MFNHIGVDIPEVKTKNVNRKRFYLTPDGGIFPSITTVLSVRKKEGLAEWRKRVGNDVANYISRTAAHRGTKVHKMVEDFLNNHEVEKDNREFLPYCLFQQMKPILKEKVNNIYAQECGLWSDKYKVAGRVDCIAEYDGVPSIIDFKTSRKPKKKEWISNYFAQAAAYSIMYEERTGIPINRSVILIAVEGEEPQVFIDRRDNYVETLLLARDKYEREVL